MKTPEQVNPNYAPVYAAALYPDLAKLFVEHGYALAVHGSLRRDFDLIAVPWIAIPSSPDIVIKEVTTKFAVSLIEGPEERHHGRTAYTISIGHGECALDLSFMPQVYTETVTTKSLPQKAISYFLDGVAFESCESTIMGTTLWERLPFEKRDYAIYLEGHDQIGGRRDDLILGETVVSLKEEVRRFYSVPPATAG